jgi:putative methyltransferase (TIGR04325 family)
VSGLLARAFDRLARAAQPRNLTYSKPYPSWNAARAVAGDHGAPQAVEAVARAARAVQTGAAAYAQGGTAHARPDYRWPLLAGLLDAAARHGAYAGTPFHVVDYGGALGATYIQHRRFLDAIPQLRWSVVELSAYAKLGAAEFADERLQFFDGFEAALTRGPADAAIFVSSLQYMETPNAVLAQLAAHNVPTVILDAMHWSREDDEVRVQRIRTLNDARLVLRFLSRRRLLATMNGLGYDMTVPLDRGLIFRKRSG